MRIGIFENTPAQFHFYKNIIKRLTERGHAVYVVARDYGETKNLIDESGNHYFYYSSSSSSKIGKAMELPSSIMKASKWLKNNQIEILTGFGTYDAFCSGLIGVPDIVFNDSEPRINVRAYKLQFKLMMQFLDAIITPTCFSTDLGRKHVKGINSIKEMAYLSNKYFTPDPSILDIIEMKEDENYAILRFNAFDAVHDNGIGGFSIENKIELVRQLENIVQYLFRMRGKPVPGLEKYVLKIPKSRIHDAIYYSKLVVGDTQTITTESALLGTPAVRCNSFVGKNDMEIFNLLENKYKAIYNFSSPLDAISKSISLIQIPSLKTDWMKKKDSINEDMIDIVDYMVEFIENYPERPNVPRGT